MGKAITKERSMIGFFLPLGLSSSLVLFSHIIINSTLARGAQPELMIAAYAIAMSIFTIAERPAVLLRQTCSTLVSDQISFRAMSRVTLYFIGCVLVFGGLIAYTPVGTWLIRFVFNADANLLGSILSTFRILMFVTVFSAVRCLYHGILIRDMRTNWLTIGMAIRLGVMYLLSLYFIYGETNINSSVGAIIFLAGMVVEAVISYLEGRKVAAKLPVRDEESTVSTPRDIFSFYKPLVYSSFIAVAIGPAINAMLGKTTKIEMAIASYALALSVAQLVISFHTYIHQIVINFYRQDARAVIRFSLLVNFIPTAIIGLLAYTVVGVWMLEGVMGVKGELLHESLQVLKVFALFTLVYPWIDFFNGLIMLHQRTQLMVWSQAANLVTTLVVLIPAVLLAPAWNGRIGALAQSTGMLLELAVLASLLYLLKRQKEKGLFSP